MDKPISMVIKESKDTIVKTINECKLHPSILELIIKDIYIDIIAVSKKASEMEEKEYLKNTKNKTEK